jgi:O-antigen ligase
MLDGLRRVSASFVHPNDFGAYIITILPLTFCFFFPALRKGKKLFLILTCILGAYCLLKTSSRAAWLAFLIGVITYFLYYRKDISIVMPLLILTVLILSPHGLERIRGLFVLEQNTVWERTQLWKGTWNMVKVHPFFGFGINTFSRYFLEYKPAVYPDIRYTHNSYLQMWSEIGIFGLAAFLAIIFTVLRESLKKMTKKFQKGFEGFILLGAITGYIAFLIQSGLDTNLYSLVLTTLFWVMNAYIISINKFLENKP